MEKRDIHVPPSHVAKYSFVLLHPQPFCKLIRPMILPPCRRPHTHQLPHRSDDAGPSEPAEKVSVDETCGAAVEQAEDEDAEQAFPGYGAAAREAEDGGA
jgi:hypothetical protein